MTSIEPKVESIEELDFDIMCKHLKVNFWTKEHIEECDQKATLWIEYHSWGAGCKTIRIEYCQEHLMRFASVPGYLTCPDCGVSPRLYNYGPL